MKTTSILPNTVRAWLVPLGTALVVVGFAGPAWVAVRPKSSADRREQPVPRPQPAEHFTGTVHYDILAKLLADDRRSAPAAEWLQELADPEGAFRVQTQTHPLLGLPAPDFTLENHQGEPWNLNGHLLRGPVVLVFYYGYGCSACVHDLFELNADLERFHSLGAEVVAISADAPALTRQRFGEYGRFGFPVLSDPGHAVARSYSTFRLAKDSNAEELIHGTFIIGRDGRLHWANSGDTPFRNNKALLYEVARLANKLPRSAPLSPAGEREAKTP